MLSHARAHPADDAPVLLPLLLLLLQAMVPSMPLRGKRVLIHAGAGGVGSFAIQVPRCIAAAAAAGFLAFLWLTCVRMPVHVYTHCY
jgi:hypothetical protein